MKRKRGKASRQEKEKSRREKALLPGEEAEADLLGEGFKKKRKRGGGDASSPDL